LFIHMMTALPRDPSARSRTSGRPSERTYSRMTGVVKEYIRREAHINQIPHDHPLRVLALKCIEDDPEKRPTAEELSVQLETMRTVRSLEQQSKIAELKQELSSLKDKIATLTSENEERKKKFAEWKHETIGLISHSFDRFNY